MARCAGRARVLVINDSWRAAPWADLLYACDDNWWNHHRGAPGFLGQKWTQDARAAERWRLRFIASRAEPGLCRDPAAIHQGGTSGYQALNLALHLGARRILLLGYDYRGAHWFGQHPAPLTNARDDEWPARAAVFDRAALDISRFWPGIEVINCSPVSRIGAFPKGDLADVL